MFFPKITLLLYSCEPNDIYLNNFHTFTIKQLYVTIYVEADSPDSEKLHLLIGLDHSSFQTNIN